MNLTELQIQMLKEEKFHLHGATSERGLIAAEELYQAGYVTRYDSGSDESQYTCYNYTITDSGRKALAAAPQAVVTPGQVYRHHSGRLYIIKNVANVALPSEKFPIMAIYVGEDNRLWARPAADFVAPRFVLTNDVGVKA